MDINLIIGIGTFLSVVIAILVSLWKFGPETDSTMAQTIESLTRSLKSVSDELEILRQQVKEYQEQVEEYKEENKKLKIQLNKKINLIEKEVKSSNGG